MQLHTLLRRAREARRVPIVGRHIAPEPGTDETAPPTSQMFPEERWFADHIEAAREVISFLDANQSSLAGRRVADVGTGDGIIALGLAVEGRPSELVAFDLNATDTEHLRALARSHQYVADLPPNLAIRAVAARPHPR